MNRVARVARGVGALGLILALVAGIPWALWHFVGWPLPHHLPSAAQVGRALNRQGIPAQTLIDALAAVVWITWAVLVVSLAAEIPAAVTGRHARRLPLAGIFQPFTGPLVAAVLVAGLSLAPRAGHQGVTGGGALPATVHRPAATLVMRDAAFTNSTRRIATATATATAPVPVTPPAVSNAGATQPAASAQPVPTPTTYVVQRGDTLWGIAERELGDPLKWSEIFELNEGRPQPDGTTLDDPHWIDPGWTLLLPVEPTAAPPMPVPNGPPAAMPPGPTNPSIAPLTTPSIDSNTPRPASSTAPTRAPASSTGEARAVDPAGAPIRLPSGSIVAGSFAAGVLSALAAGRLRRRRHYRPQPPRPGRHLKVEPQSAGLRDLLVTVRATHNDEDQDLTADVRNEPTPMTAIPDGEALARPDVIEVAIRGDEVVRFGICDWPGLAISGPGADACLRAWLAALITRNGPYGAEILVVGPLGDRLFPGLEVPGLRRFETLDGALSRLEPEMAVRTRRLDDADVADAVAHRAMSPEYPLPLLLIVTDVVPESVEPRWRSMAAQATRLGIAAVLLIPSHASDELREPYGRIVVGEGGWIEGVTPPALAELLEGSTLFGLSAAESADLLSPVASIHNEHKFDEHDPLDPFSENGLPGGSALEADVVLGGGAAEANLDDNPLIAERNDAGAISWPAPDSPDPEPAPIRVELFGPALVEAWGEKVSSGLRASAYELLAWYALRPEGATAEAAIEALWPDVSPQRGRERFWTALGNLRSRLHGPGEDGVEILAKVGDHYRPDPSALDIDLWRFEAALTDVTRAEEGVEIVAALERAAAAYGGEFHPSADALWVEPAREDLHRRALDVHIRLAELYADDGRSDAAIAVLERAIDLDPICEDAYRRLIVLEVGLGRADAAQRTWRLLLGRLAELDLEPEGATAELVHEVLSPRPMSSSGRARS